MSREIVYLILIFGLLVIPRALQRFRIPAPITCLLFGIIAMLFMSDQTHDPVIVLLSTLGISSLFLFAGLEVDLQALRRGWWPLLVHLTIRIGSLVLFSWLGWRFLDLDWQPAALLALALLTPSTGFILDTLERLGLDEEERFWVTSKAIAGELFALAALFVVLQAGDPVQLGTSTLVMLAMIAGLPLLFIAFGRWIVPHAPGSEFSLLVMVGFVAAFITYKLGVYYLVGAFIAGLVARLLQVRMPRLASHENITALRLFATFFVPFYFFHAGTLVARDAFSLEALGFGLLVTVVVVPVRVGMVWLQRRIVFRGEHRLSTFRVSVALTPTLVFTLVLAQILHSRFQLSGMITGGLILYTTLNTLLPSLLLRAPFDPMADESAALESTEPATTEPAPTEEPATGVTAASAQV